MKTLEFQKTEEEIVRVSDREYLGCQYVDVRVFYKTKTQGELIPTKKGLILKKELFEKVIKKCMEELCSPNK